MHGWRHAGAQPASGGGSGPVEFALEVGHDFLALLSRLQQQSESSSFMAYMQQRRGCMHSTFEDDMSHDDMQIM